MDFLISSNLPQASAIRDLKYYFVNTFRNGLCYFWKTFNYLFNPFLLIVLKQRHTGADQGDRIATSFCGLMMNLRAQKKETNQKGHSFDVRRSRRQIPAYTRERAAAMFLGSIVREFYYKQYGENRTMIIKSDCLQKSNKMRNIWQGSKF